MNDSSDPSEAIAIVAQACRFPKANNLEAYWDLLISGKEARQEIPAERWDWRDHYDPSPQSGKSYAQWGCFLDNIHAFDPLFFRISPSEAKYMDPQQRLMLEVVWEAFEQGGLRPSDWRGSNTGVFVGVSAMDYGCLITRDISNISHYSGLGTNLSIIANRVSFIYDFHGPSFAIDTACSSSLSALHQACQALKQKQCDSAVVGSVNALLQPVQYVGHAQGGILSNDGHCRPFDAHANGIVRGEGCGVVLLKRLSDAIADQDRIESVILASGMNQDGFTNGIFSPNRFAQEALLQQVWQQPAVNPAHIGYIEAHGTGTTIGDPIEVKALSYTFQQCLNETPDHSCYLGSVKANLGHLEAAAGMASLLKVNLALKHKRIPAQINFNQLNPHLDLSESHLHISQTEQAFPETNAAPCATISSFSFGGSNAHVVLQAYEKSALTDEVFQAKAPENHPHDDNTSDHSAHVLLFSAKQKTALIAFIESLAQWLSKQLSLKTSAQAESNPDFSLQNIAYTLQVGREAFPERLAFMANNLEDLAQKLQQLSQHFSDANQTNAESIDTFVCYQGRAHLKLSKAPALALQAGIDSAECEDYAKQWVKGQNFVWQDLYQGLSTQRLALPSHPFVHKTFGFQAYEISPYLASEHDNRNPLLGQNRSSLNQLGFTTRFTGTEPFLRDHQYQQQPLMPATAYLEMACASAEVLAERSIQAIHNVVWLQPFIWQSTQAELMIRFKPKKAVADHAAKQSMESSFFQIYSKSDTHNERLHSRGKVYFTRARDDAEAKKLSNDDPVLQALDLPALDKAWFNAEKKRSEQRLSGSDLYQHFANLPLHYGASHQTVKQVYLGARFVLAELRCPATEQQNVDRYGLHPGMLDGALQIGAFSSPLFSDLAKTTPLFLPFSLKALHYYQAFSTKAWVIAQLQDNQSESISVNILVVDPKAGLIASLEGMRYRKVEASNISI